MIKIQCAYTIDGSGEISLYVGRYLGTKYFISTDYLNEIIADSPAFVEVMCLLEVAAKIAADPEIVVL